MSDWIYVDNSNLFIEGQRVSAVQNHMARDIYDSMENGIFDYSHRLSFAKLFRFITDSPKEEVGRAMIFGSGPLENEGIRGMAEFAGFEVKVHARNFSNKEKKVDTDIVATMVRDAYKNAKKGDTFNLAAGDKDYVPAVELMVSDGIKVDVVFWDHAAAELKNACSEFISLNPHLELLQPKPREEGMSQTA